MGVEWKTVEANGTDGTIGTNAVNARNIRPFKR